MANIIGTIIFGAVIGIIAKFISSKGDSVSVLWTVILGIVGVLVGNGILGLFNYPTDTPGIDWIRWIVCIIAAIVAIGIYVGIVGRKSTK